MAGREIKEFDLVRLLNYVKEEKKWPFTKIPGKKMARTWSFGKLYERPKEKNTNMYMVWMIYSCVMTLKSRVNT